MTRRFDMHERKALLDLLVRAESEASRIEVWPGTFDDIAAVLRQVIPDADLVIEQAGRIEFTGAKDWATYTLTKAGFFRFDDENKPVSAHDWWVAVLRTHAYFASLHLEEAEA